MLRVSASDAANQMSTPSTLDALPLASRTPDAWAVAVLQEPLALLNDHA